MNPMAKSANSQESHPDWAALEVELRCDRCGYNLRMLQQPRCPECGLTFHWNDAIFDAKHGVASTLFEYKWRSRPVGSLLKTLGLTLLPWRMWSRTPLRCAPRIGPLLALVPLTCLIYAGLAFVRIQAWYWLLREKTAGPGSFLGLPPWGAWRTTDIFVELGLPSLFGILFLLVIQLFWKTRARYHIRTAHIVRIVVLTWVGLLMTRSLIEIVCAFAYALIRRYNGHQISYPDYLMATAGVVFLLLSFGIAFSVYLKVRGAWLWALVLIVSTAIPTAGLLLAASICVYDTYTNPLADMLHIWGKHWWGSVFV